MSTENVLQGILSQKIVQTGGVYSVKTDLVNVDNIKLDPTSSQAGKIVFTTSPSVSSVDTTVPGVTPASIVILSPTTSFAGTYTLSTQTNNIRLVLGAAANVTFNYFVAKY
jgi:hypothetical protein